MLDACQVTNPSIDPLREPMELRTYLGRKPDERRGRVRRQRWLPLNEGAGIAQQHRARHADHLLADELRSVSINVHKSLAMAAERCGILMNTGEGGLHADLYPYGQHDRPGRLGTLRRESRIPERGAAIEIKVGQGAKPGIGGHLPGEKINKEVSRRA